MKRVRGKLFVHLVLMRNKRDTLIHQKILYEQRNSIHLYS